MCAGRRGEDEDSDGKGSDGVKALLRIARDALLGVRRLEITRVAPPHRRTYFSHQ